MLPVDKSCPGGFLLHVQNAQGYLYMHVHVLVQV